MSEFESTSIHEAGHAVIWMLEQEHLSPLTIVSALPLKDTLGHVQGEDGALSQRTPRKLRAMARVLAAGGIAEKLAGLSSTGVDPADARKLAGLALIAAKLLQPSVASRKVRERRAKRFREQAEAGAELMLRAYWGSVLRLAATLREFGTLAGDSGIALARLKLDGPQRPLIPDAVTFFHLCRAVARVPELAEPLVAKAREELLRVA
jgi:hypothetical protein